MNDEPTTEEQLKSATEARRLIGAAKDLLLIFSEIKSEKGSQIAGIWKDLDNAYDYLEDFNNMKEKEFNREQRNYSLNGVF